MAGYQARLTSRYHIIFFSGKSARRGVRTNKPTCCNPQFLREGSRYPISCSILCTAWTDSLRNLVCGKGYVCISRFLYTRNLFCSRKYRWYRVPPHNLDEHSHRGGVSGGDAVICQDSSLPSFRINTRRVSPGHIHILIRFIPVCPPRTAFWD